MDNPNYGKIINEKHFERLCGLMKAFEEVRESAVHDEEKAILGGEVKRETLQIAPTVLDNATWSDAVMQEEIFGPVLPILTFTEFDDIFDILKDKAKPLALYLFSEDKAHVKAVTERIQYGGGCINDTIIHLATSEMGFGGVGESGMGSYHGREGFNTFSHTKSIVDKKHGWIWRCVISLIQRVQIS